MEAKELRLGNYINYLGVATIVESIAGIEQSYVATKSSGIMPINSFNPIPLTKEWLLKFGFQRHDQGSVSAQFSYGTNPVTQDYLIYLKWIKDYENDYHLNGFPFYQNGYFEIKHVHQLQNLIFTLCGEELKLN